MAKKKKRKCKVEDCTGTIQAEAEITETMDVYEDGTESKGVISRDFYERKFICTEGCEFDGYQNALKGNSDY